jgi:hypothetical protein
MHSITADTYTHTYTSVLQESQSALAEGMSGAVPTRGGPRRLGGGLPAAGSAREFALSALEAHHTGTYRRVPLDAGTALEHLAKACLARRSPALLADLKSRSSVDSLIFLLRIDGAGVPTKVRTVGLQEALARIDRFGVKSKAVSADLQSLVDLRNGLVHTAQDVEVEERILAAFVQHADSLIKDLDRSRDDFWGDQLAAVDALLEDASDKVAHRVTFRLAAATARLERRYTAEGDAFVNMVRTFSKSAALTGSQRFQPCPVYDSFGIAAGEHSVSWFAEEQDKDTGDFSGQGGQVSFMALHSIAGYAAFGWTRRRRLTQRDSIPGGSLTTPTGAITTSSTTTTQTPHTSVGATSASFSHPPRQAGSAAGPCAVRPDYPVGLGEPLVVLAAHDRPAKPDGIGKAPKSVSVGLVVSRLARVFRVAGHG